MKGRLFLIVGIGVLLGGDSRADDQLKVFELLKKLNGAYLQKDAATMKQLMSDDHLAIVASGVRQTKEEHLQGLADLKLSEYSMNDVRVTFPTKEMAIITYVSGVKGTYKGKELPAKVAAASVWANRNGQWLEVLYQETALPAK